MAPAVIPVGRPWQELNFPCALIPTGFPGDSVVNNQTAMKSLGQEGLLDEEMATHCSILAWRIPWTEDPGRLQSTGFRVTHDFHHTYSIAQPGRLWLCSPDS